MREFDEEIERALEIYANFREERETLESLVPKFKKIVNTEELCDYYITDIVSALCLIQKKKKELDLEKENHARKLKSVQDTVQKEIASLKKEIELLKKDIELLGEL